MLFLQTLITLIRRSVGKVVESIFGWAVAALFGEVGPKEKTLLSMVVGAVALWPILLAGIAFPKVAAFVLAFVPLSKRAPEGLLRILWGAVALLIPLLVGFVLQRRQGVKRWKLANVLAGFPLTIGLSCAFALAFFALPVQKLVALLRGLREEHVTLILEDAQLGEVAEKLLKALREDGFELKPSRAPWLSRAIAWLLRRTASLVGNETSQPRYYRDSQLELTLYPHGATVRGLPRATGRAHALIAGTATGTPALQTTDASAQKLEREIKALWNQSRGRAARHHPADRSFQRLVRELSLLSCPYEDWQILYRECLQLGFVRRGLADPIAEAPGQRVEARPSAGRVRRFTRRARGLTRERAAASVAKSFTTLAQNLVNGFLGKRIRH